MTDAQPSPRTTATAATEYPQLWHRPGVSPVTILTRDPARSSRLLQQIPGLPSLTFSQDPTATGPLLLLHHDIAPAPTGEARPTVLLISPDLDPGVMDDATVWQQAVAILAQHVMFLEDAPLALHTYLWTGHIPSSANTDAGWMAAPPPPKPRAAW